MVFRIRLSRFGAKTDHFTELWQLIADHQEMESIWKYWVTTIHYHVFSFSGQDGGKRMGLNFDRVKYWSSVGAQPSEPVQRILFRSGLLPLPPMLAMAHKGGPHDTHAVDPLSGRFVALKESTVSDQPEGEGDGEKSERSS